MSGIILASKSPRRKELFEKLNIPFEVMTSEATEEIDQTMAPDKIVIELSIRKARAVAAQYPNRIVIGADTIVACQNSILGKPADRSHAKEMLTMLSDQTHTVYTGVAIIHEQHVHTFCEKTDVTFWKLSHDEMEEYLDSDEPYDKAGAYGIQGIGAFFVKSITGDFYAVMGLPISRLRRLLRKMGI